MQKRGRMLHQKLYDSPLSTVTLHMRHADLVRHPDLASRALMERTSEIKRLKQRIRRAGAWRIQKEGMHCTPREARIILKADDVMGDTFFDATNDPTGIAEEMWRCQIKALTSGLGKTSRGPGSKRSGLRYHPALYRMALSVLAKAGPAAYEELRSLLFFPSTRSLRKRKLDRKRQSGVMCETLIAFLSTFDPKKELFCLSFDSMKIVDGITYNSFSGDIVGVDESVTAMTSAAFEAAAKEVLGERNDAQVDHTRAAEEYFVWILSSVTGRCSIRFPIARFTAGAGKTAAALIQQFYEVERSILQHGIRVIALTADGAGENRQLFRALATIPVSRFLDANMMRGVPEEAREKWDIINVARPHPLFGEALPMFLIPDPSHFIKKMCNALEFSNTQASGRQLRFPRAEGRGSERLCLAMLEHVWELSEKCRAHLPLRNRKLKRHHFRKDPALRMRVHLAAQVLSNTMVRIIDENVPPDQAAKYRPLRTYVKTMNDLLDIVNTRHGLVYEKSDPRMMKLLDIYGFYRNWDEAVRHVDLVELDGVSRKMAFIDGELFHELKLVCLGFPCLVAHYGESGDTSLCLRRISSDVCEHHFGNIRASARTGGKVSAEQAFSATSMAACVRIAKSLKTNSGQLLLSPCVMRRVQAERSEDVISNKSADEDEVDPARTLIFPELK